MSQIKSGLVPPREFTVEEANAQLPRVAEIVPRLREAVTAYKFHAEQLADLREMWGPEIELAENQDHRDYTRHRAEASKWRAESERSLETLAALGVEIKDPFAGLVDFYGRVDGELVYLCWKEGERAVEHWHSLTEGFAGRKPL